AFINIPPANAWDEYDTIFEAAKKYSTDWLVLISAGPTATVLAYDLYKVGYQALDIGHIAASLKEVYDGAPIPERTPFRNENE
ncbi:MAG: GT-D fold domain-containing protein, partial [Deferribacteraceae bacterium]|nr:GT-D fold domain-containing protein [Deferribacteraceae bacterium]